MSRFPWLPPVEFAERDVAEDPRARQVREAVEASRTREVQLAAELVLDAVEAGAFEPAALATIPTVKLTDAQRLRLHVARLQANAVTLCTRAPEGLVDRDVHCRRCAAREVATADRACWESPTRAGVR